MKNRSFAFVWRYIAFPALAAVVMVVGAEAQEGDQKVPQSGFRAEVLMDLARLEEKVIGLAEAVPADDYGWRPAEGIRTISEAYMHLAGSTHQILQGLGYPPPDDVGDWESIVDKEQVISLLKSTFGDLKAAVLETSDESLEEQVEFFGRQWSRRAVFYLAATHIHEHLGQSIAYARSVGVAPPWSAAAQ